VSIINEKYKGKYKGASDWIGRLIEEKCTKITKTKAKGDEPAKETKELHIPSLFALAKANGLDKEKLDALKAQQDTPNAPGRIRMTIGNMLRAAAKRRHGLVDTDGTTLTPDADFVLPAEPVEDLAGEKIAKAPKEAAAKAEKAPAKKAAAKKPPKKAA
jgi:hypothetical protein